MSFKYIALLRLQHTSDGKENTNGKQSFQFYNENVYEREKGTKTVMGDEWNGMIKRKGRGK